MRKLAWLTVVIAAAGALVASVASIGTAAPNRVAGTTLSLVAYSTPRDAYTSLIPMFAKTADGDGVSFTQS